MKLYPENYDVAVEVPFVDLNGAQIVPTSVNAVLYDGEDREIVDFGSLPFDPAEAAKTIQVPAAFNVLGSSSLNEARILVIKLVTNAGTITKTHSYIIEGAFRLSIMQNSFMSLEAAEILARDMPELKGWEDASVEKKNAALINAYTRITRLTLKFLNEQEGVEEVIGASSWRDVTPADFASMPDRFRKAVRTAQLSEADAILTDDPYRDRHEAGVISESVGESTVMLRGGRLDLGLNRKSIDCLAGFIFYNFRITRG